MRGSRISLRSSGLRTETPFISAKAGIQKDWVPAFAGTSGYEPRQLARNTCLPYDAAKIVAREGGRVGRTSTGAAALCAGGAEPHRADRRVVPFRQAGRGAEIRAALALRDGARAARAQLSLAGKYRGHHRRDFRWLYSRRRLRHRRGAP